jgi:hypothetical protein
VVAFRFDRATRRTRPCTDRRRRFSQRRKETNAMPTGEKSQFMGSIPLLSFKFGQGSLIRGTQRNARGVPFAWERGPVTVTDCCVSVGALVAQ